MAGQRPAFPHIGWDPTPGSVEDTRDLAKQLGKLAGELGTALHELERIECGAWKGKTAIAFTEYIGKDVTPLARKSHDSFDKASRALHRWAADLQDFQDRADRLEKSAGEKLDAKAKAQASRSTRLPPNTGTSSATERWRSYGPCPSLPRKATRAQQDTATEEPTGRPSGTEYPRTGPPFARVPRRSVATAA
ncbi:hypothetical protein ACWDGI_00550 [Streptomyces sp. NPDC001220]